MTVLDTFRLDNRVAVVTGASSGLGVAFAAALTEAGADVVLAARRADGLLRVTDQITALGRRAIAIPTDVTEYDQCQGLIDETVGRLGRI